MPLNYQGTAIIVLTFIKKENEIHQLIQPCTYNQQEISIPDEETQLYQPE